MQILYSALKNRSESLTDGNCINWTFQIHQPSLSPPQEDEGCHYPLNTFGGCVLVSRARLSTKRAHREERESRVTPDYFSWQLPECWRHQSDGSSHVNCFIIKFFWPSFFARMSMCDFFLSRQHCKWSLFVLHVVLFQRVSKEEI